MKFYKKIISVIFIFMPFFLLADINPPLNFNLTRWDSAIELTWADANSTTPVADYKIYRSTYQNLNEFYFNITFSAGGNVTKYVDSLINTYEPYYYAVQTIDLIGNTSSLSVVKPAFPYNLTITAFNAKNFLLWNSNPAITSYNIYRSTSVMGEYFAIKTSFTSNEYLDTEVTNGILYFYKIAGIYGSSEAPFSSTKSAKPFASPFPPKNLSYNISVDLSGNTNVIITWSNQNIKGTYPISGFKIYRSLVYNDESDFSGFSTSTGFVDTIPQSGLKYYYKIKTQDINGNTSNPVYFETYINGRASKPKGLTITAQELGSITLSWIQNSTYENVTVYVVYRATYEQIGQTSFNFFTDNLNLNPGEVVNYHIRALNAYGLSDFSEALTITVKPKMPLNFSLNQTEPAKIKILWNANGENENITIYNIYRVIPPASIDVNNPYYVFSTTITSGTLEFTDASANTGVFYSYAVAGVTVNASSNYVTGTVTAPLYITPVSIPQIPQNLSITAFNSYVKIFWDKNSTFEKISGYNIFKSTADIYDLYQHITKTVNNYYYDTGLNTYTTYYYKINAENYFGWASTLTAYVAVTPYVSNLIDKPSGVTLISEGDGNLKLYWNQANPADNVTSYNIYRSTVSGFYNLTPYTYTSMTYYVDISVTAGNQYYYIVKSVGITESAASDEVSGIPFIKPYPPVNISLKNIHNTILLSWASPSLKGTYQTQNQYNIYRNTSPNNFALLKSKCKDNYFIDSNVNTGLTYYYKIKSVDDNNNEDAINTYYSLNLIDVSFPPDVLVAYAGENWVTLNWKRVTLTAEAYNIYRSTISGYFGEPLAYSLSVNSYKEYTDYTVQKGITYYYVITSINSAGEGPKSNEVKITPYKIASLPSDSQIKYEIRNKKDIYLFWNKAVDGDYPIIGYVILRSNDGGAYYSEIGYVTATANPEFFDTATQWDNIYYYMIKTVDLQLNKDATYPILKIELPAPKNKLILYSNLINLSKNEKLKLKFQAVKTEKVKIKVFTLSGYYVTTLIDDKIPDGISVNNPYESSEFFWDGKNSNGEKVASGIYLIILEIKNEKVIQKVAVIK